VMNDRKMVDRNMDVVLVNKWAELWRVVVSGVRGRRPLSSLALFEVAPQALIWRSIVA